MKELVKKYADRLNIHGLVDKDAPIIGIIETSICWSRYDKKIAELEKIFKGLGVNSLFLSRPTEPYNTIVTIWPL